jgi:hypothetical protein
MTYNHKNSIQSFKTFIKEQINNEDKHRKDLEIYLTLTVGGERVVEDNEHFYEQLQHNIKYSLYKEKFFRYLYNNNTPKYYKYHDKLLEIEHLNMENASENSDKTCISVIDMERKEFGDRDIIAQRGDEGYRNLCDTYKEQYEFRIKMMGLVDGGFLTMK